MYKKDNDGKMPQLFIVVEIGKEHIQTYAFIDFGADGNTISYEMFKPLKHVNLKDIDDVFQSYTGHKTQAFGVCKLDLNVSELICKDKFFVTLPKMQDVPIILGRTWLKKYNCFLDWHCTLAHC